jgi:hypothetical protein
MDSESLVDADIEIGKEATEALSADKELNLRASLWYFEEDRRQWLFTVATPVHDHRGAQAAYFKIRRILVARALLSRLPLEKVWVIDERHAVLDALRDFIGESTNVRLQNVVIGHIAISDVYVYRIAKRRARTKKRAG